MVLNPPPLESVPPTKIIKNWKALNLDALRKECIDRGLLSIDDFETPEKKTMSAMLSCYECNLYTTGTDGLKVIDLAYIKLAEDIWHGQRSNAQKLARAMGVADDRTIGHMLARMLLKEKESRANRSIVVVQGQSLPC
jgi:hypothetical protein